MNRTWLVDAHCHLDLLKEIQSNVKVEDNLPIKTITVTNAPSFYEHNLDLFKDVKNIRLALGLHPELVPIYKHELGKFEQLLPTTRYIGEIGLDGSKQYFAHFQLQVEIFTKIVWLVAAADNKVLTVHSRNAVNETIEILSKALRGRNCKVIFHWYTGDLKALSTAIEQGYYFSVNHKMVCTKKGQDVIKYLPLNKILTETDAPFTLGNNENREKALSRTIAGIATVRDINKESVVEQVFQNFKKLLSL